MKTIISGIIIAIVVFIGFQMIMPFPYGIIFGLVFGGLVIRYTIKHATIGKDSLLNYRRTDPINEKEKEQNDEALRILEKKYIEEKISKEKKDLKIPNITQGNAKFAVQRILNLL